MFRYTGRNNKLTETKMRGFYTLSIILTLILLSIETTVIAQCDFQVQSQNCISKIQEGFIYVKSFNINGQNGDIQEIEYPYVMTKDTQYYLNICTAEEDPDGIIMTIYDATRNPVGTNYADNTYFPTLIFQCSATGIYYITYTFKNSKNYCGGSSLAFKK